MSLIEPIQTIELLVESVQRLSLAGEMREIASIVCAASRRLTGADGASFLLREGSQGLYLEEDGMVPLWKGQRFVLEGSIAGWVIGNRTPVAIPDVFHDARIEAETFRSTQVRSLAMAPIRTTDPIGTAAAYWSRQHQPTPDQVRLLQALADSAAAAIESIRIYQELEERVRRRTEDLESANEELRAEVLLRKRMEAKVLRLSLTDDLTGLNNRRGFLLRAEQLLKLVHRVRTFGWLVYIDLDGLKQVNDELGHEAGDRLICAAAKVMRESFRDSDVIGRIGGDEFVVFATGASAPTPEVEERLKRNIESHNHCYPDQPALAMSIGVTRCDSHSPDTLEDMIHRADAAMYIEKRRKRAHPREEASE